MDHNPDKEFFEACDSKDLEKIRRIYEMYRDDLEMTDALNECGDVDVLKYLHFLHQPDRDQVINNFVSACAKGTQNVTEWLYDTYNITKKEILKPLGLPGNDLNVFTYVQVCGNTKMIGWLVDKFKIEM